MSEPKLPRILIVRRDNIGDLVCTTPLLAALRQQLPDCWIGVWANSYNAPVLDGNPDVDAVYVYTKAKHREDTDSIVGIFWRRLRLLRQLRALKIDDVVIATTSPQPRLVRMARWLKPKRVIAFGQCGADIELPLDDQTMHEVEDVMRVARLYGYQAPPPACKIVSPLTRNAQLVAIHISARKPSQRWPTENFVELLKRLHAQKPELLFRLFWAPGAENDAKHPGDDEKAEGILSTLPKEFPIEARPTQHLRELIAGLSECSVIICSDGGAMHIAAGLGIPIVCLFGNSGAARWRPWGVPFRLLQKAQLDVALIAASEVAEAFSSLQADTRELLPANLP